MNRRARPICRPFRAIFVSLAALSVLGTGCGPSEEAPLRDAMLGFIDAYHSQEYDRCLDSLSTRLRTGSSDEVLIEELRDDLLWSVATGIKKMGAPEVSGARATVFVTFRAMHWELKEVQVSLVNEDGRWKIDEWPKADVAGQVAGR